jgi:hypothetical protein
MSYYQPKYKVGDVVRWTTRFGEHLGEFRRFMPGPFIVKTYRNGKVSVTTMAGDRVCGEGWSDDLFDNAWFEYDEFLNAVHRSRHERQVKEDE